MDILKMQKCHVKDVEEMAKVFYYSDAVCHDIPWENVENTINEAVSPSEILEGYVFDCDGNIAGFGLITKYFESECGGVCVQLMDLFVKSEFRGRGIAKKYFEFIFDKYSYAKRFRLEAAPDNEKAIRLYKSLGFHELSYMQMIKEETTV